MCLVPVQEACVAGMEAALEPGDEVITAYRCHGWTYTRGVEVKHILAELAGEGGREGGRKEENGQGGGGGGRREKRRKGGKEERWRDRRQSRKPQEGKNVREKYM